MHDGRDENNLSRREKGWPDNDPSALCARGDKGSRLNPPRGSTAGDDAPMFPISRISRHPRASNKTDDVISYPPYIYEY